jgi:ASC-1-like (ASCH) protein
MKLVEYNNCTVWPIKIYPEPFKDIKENGKEIEGRVPDPNKKRKRYQNISSGDIIHFILRKNGNNIKTDYAYRVLDNRHYENIRDMLESEDLNKVLPSVDSIDSGVKKYESFSGYEERANKYGACAIELGKSVEVDWNYQQ